MRSYVAVLDLSAEMACKVHKQLSDEIVGWSRVLLR